MSRFFYFGTEGDDTGKMTGTIPTQLGMLTSMGNRLYLNGHSLSSSIPTQLGQMSEMTNRFYLDSNKICSDVPTQVQALSSSVAVQVTNGNSIGTVCGWDGSYMTDSRFPTMDGSTSSDTHSYEDEDLTGTIPTEFGLMTHTTELGLARNTLTGTLPSQLGCMSKVETGSTISGYGFVRSNHLDGALPSELGRWAGGSR